MACRGAAVVRLDDRMILSQVQGADVIDAVTWSDAVSRCANLAEKSIDRVAYAVKSCNSTVYTVIRKADGVGSICVMADTIGQRVGYLGCEKVLETFQKLFLERASSLSPLACASFATQLAEIVAQLNDTSVVDDRVAKVKKAVEEVKEIALENVDRVIERGEKIESMVEQTEQLQMDAKGFHTRTVELRRQLWWNNMRMKLMAAGAVFVFCLVVYLVFCGGFSCSN